ncbi:hypothetical protein DDY07_22595 [Methylomonas sp. ZR1]|nr:hypothetical protein [Methylomonas sp. ZR1]
MQLAVMALLWVSVIVAFIFFTRKSKPFVKLIFFIFSLLSVPVYVYINALYETHLNKINEEVRLKSEMHSTQMFKEICNRQHVMVLNKAIRDDKPIDLTVNDKATSVWGFRIFEPVHPEKDVCWLKRDFSNCAHSNIGNVEWSWKMSDSLCNHSINDAKCKHHYVRNDRNGNERIEIDRIYAKFGIFVSDGEYIDNNIKKYDISIMSLENKEVLAKTVIYFKLRGYIIQDKDELLYCPPRDEQIAKMLSSVFPLAK